jgi:hypothetical protein
MTGTGSKVQGEGDYESARRFNKHATESVQSSSPADHKAAPRNRQEAEELMAAERAGKERARSASQAPRDAKKMAELERKSEQKHTPGASKNKNK